MSIKAIETSYDGYKFRSRVEARWAVFFNHLGLGYEYEPEGYDLGDAGYYLPDFWLPQEHAWFEVKGKWPGTGSPESAKAVELAHLTGHNVYEACGSTFKQHGFNHETADFYGQVIRNYTPDHKPQDDYESDYGLSWRWCVTQDRPTLELYCCREDGTFQNECGLRPYKAKLIDEAYAAARAARFEYKR